MLANTQPSSVLCFASAMRDQESVEDVDAAVSESCDLATSRRFLAVLSVLSTRTFTDNRQVIFWTGLAYAFLCAVLTSSLEVGGWC